MEDGHTINRVKQIQNTVNRSKNIKDPSISESVQKLQFKLKGSMLIGLFLKQIKTWSCTCKMKLLRNQYIKRQDFRDAIFNKRVDWFVSANHDKSVQFWKEQEQGQWKGAKRMKIHKSIVLFLLLNNNEDQLITNSDRGITMWKVHYQKNQLEQYQYIDLNKRQGRVLSINQNYSNTKIVLLTHKSMIILLGQGDDGKWLQLTEYLMIEQISSVYFLNDFKIGCKQQDITNVCHILNNQIIHKPDEKFVDDKFKKISDLLQTQKIYAFTIVEDGNYFVFENIQGLRIYRIQYPIKYI